VYTTGSQILKLISIRLGVERCEILRYSKVTINGHEYYRLQLAGLEGKRITLYAKTVEEMREKEQRCRENIQRIKRGGGVSTEDYANFQLELIRPTVKPQTFRGYEAKTRLYVIKYLGEKRISDVTEDDVRAVLARVAPMSASSYRMVYTLLRRIFGAAKRSRIIEYDPTEGIASKGGCPQKERVPLTDEEIQILLGAIQGLQAETFCRIALYAGLRREEVLGLQWDCVHLDEGAPYIEVKRVWRVEHNRPVISTELKTKAAGRRIPIPVQLSEHLRELKAVSNSEFVIHNSEGGALSETQWRNLWKKVAVRTTTERTYTRYSNGKKEVHRVKAELGKSAAHNPSVVYGMDFKVTPHQLRHTYISKLIHERIDLKTVQYLAGHEKSNKVTLDVYAKVMYNQPEELADSINVAFAPK